MSDDTISIGELHRTCGRIEASLDEIRQEMKADRHALAGRIDAHGMQLAILQDRSGREKGTASKWGGAIGAAMGGLLGVLTHLFGSK